MGLDRQTKKAITFLRDGLLMKCSASLIFSNPLYAHEEHNKV